MYGFLLPLLYNVMIHCEELASNITFTTSLFKKWGLLCTDLAN